jgi:trimeric autotransporter adhesin
MRNTRRAPHLLLTLLAACGTGGTENSGTITIGLSPTSATVQQGGSQDVTATLTRGGGFTGTVGLSVTGAPTGVTATASNVTTVGLVTTATVTLSVDAAVAPGTYPLVVHGTGLGVAEATTTFPLTVTSPTPAYVIIVSNTPTIAQGTSGPVNIALVRQNFTGNVTLSLEGNPAGITGTFVPNPVTANTSLLTVSVASTVAPGTYNMMVRGTSTLTDRTQTISILVTAGQ